MATSVAAAATRLSLRRTRARIIALPITRPRIPGRTVSPPTASSPPHSMTVHPPAEKLLTYYQFQLSSAKGLKATVAAAEGEGEGEGEKKGWLASKLPKEGIATFAQNKAADLWASFGRAKGGWKLKVFQLGERAMDRIEFEELALKSIDPSLGPTVGHPASSVVERAGREKVDSSEQIPLLYPASITSPEAALDQLKTYATHRAPIHRKGFITWAVIAPLMTPFMIVPVIPNLPFFFCVWRSWSHYKAYKSSQYLQALLDHGKIVPRASDELDALYTHALKDSVVAEQSHSSSKGANTESTPLLSKHEILLSKHSVPPLVTTFELDANAEAELYRAVEQAKVRVEKGQI